MPSAQREEAGCVQSSKRAAGECAARVHSRIVVPMSVCLCAQQRVCTMQRTSGAGLAGPYMCSAMCVALLVWVGGWVHAYACCTMLAAFSGTALCHALEHATSDSDFFGLDIPWCPCLCDFLRLRSSPSSVRCTWPAAHPKPLPCSATR